MSKREPTVVGDIMTTNVVTLLPEQNLVGVADALRFFEYRHVPVVDDGRLVGIVSRLDVVQAAASRFEADRGYRTERIAGHVFISEVMTTEVHTARVDTPLVKAVQTMRFYKIGCLPVVDDERRLVGIVTTSDILTLAVHLLETRGSPGS